MANDIIVTRSTKSGNVTLPEFTKEGQIVNIADEPRRLKIAVTTKINKATKNKFKAVSGYVRLNVINDEGANEGLKVKKLTVHFTKDAFKDAVNVKSPDDLKAGYLYCKAKDLQLPSVYKVTVKKDEDGEDMYDNDGNAILEYPVIWIKGVIGLEAFVTSQDALNVDEEESKDVVIDAETGEITETEDLSQYDDASEEEVKI